MSPFGGQKTKRGRELFPPLWLSIFVKVQSGLRFPSPARAACLRLYLCKRFSLPPWNITSFTSVVGSGSEAQPFHPQLLSISCTLDGDLPLQTQPKQGTGCLVSSNSLDYSHVCYRGTGRCCLCPQQSNMSSFCWANRPHSLVPLS